MKTNRRIFLGMAIGAAQMTLLRGIGGGRSIARAGVSGGGPTKLLTIYIGGGVHWEHFFCPFKPGRIVDQLGPPGLYGPDNVENFDGSGTAAADAAIKRIRGPIRWDWSNPGEWHNGYDGKGYVWAAPEHKLYDHTIAIHGIDNQTAAHYSGIVASVCGVAGSTFAAPALQAHVANYFVEAFPERVVPSVVIGGGVRAPQLKLPATASPTNVSSVNDLKWQLSDRPGHWDQFRERTMLTDVGFDGKTPRELSATILERYALDATRRQRGVADSIGTDRVLEQLYDNYAGVSVMLAKDVMTKMENTPGFEYWPANGGAPAWSRLGMLGWTQGLADESYAAADATAKFGLALQFLKSGLTTSVALQMPSFTFDYHNGGSYPTHSYRFHGVMETIGRVLVEMKNTPLSDGRSLLDDTLVYIYSDFGRTFVGDDHNPMTSAILVGGGLVGNKMIGEFDDSSSGMPVAITSEGGQSEMRPPKSQDTIATILNVFGMQPGSDFFLPGGYGVIDGVVES